MSKNWKKREGFWTLIRTDFLATKTLRHCTGHPTAKEKLDTDLHRLKQIYSWPRINTNSATEGTDAVLSAAEGEHREFNIL